MAGLVLNFRLGESAKINDDIIVTLEKIRGKQAKIRFDCDKDKYNIQRLNRKTTDQIEEQDVHETSQPR